MTREQIAEFNPKALLCDGFDDAIIGIADRFSMEPVVAYDTIKILDILMTQMNVTQEDLTRNDILNGISVEDKKYEMALEHFEYNIIGSWMGEGTPVFITIPQ